MNNKYSKRRNKRYKKLSNKKRLTKKRYKKRLTKKSYKKRLTKKRHNKKDLKSLKNNLIGGADIQSDLSRSGTEGPLLRKDWGATDPPRCWTGNCEQCSRSHCKTKNYHYTPGRAVCGGFDAGWYRNDASPGKLEAEQYAASMVVGAAVTWKWPKDRSGHPAISGEIVRWTSDGWVEVRFPRELDKRDPYGLHLLAPDDNGLRVAVFDLYGTDKLIDIMTRYPFKAEFAQLLSVPPDKGREGGLICPVCEIKERIIAQELESAPNVKDLTLTKRPAMPDDYLSHHFHQIPIIEENLSQRTSLKDALLRAVGSQVHPTTRFMEVWERVELRKRDERGVPKFIDEHDRIARYRAPSDWGCEDDKIPVDHDTFRRLRYHLHQQQVYYESDGEEQEMKEVFTWANPLITQVLWETEQYVVNESVKKYWAEHKNMLFIARTCLVTLSDIYGISLTELNIMEKNLEDNPIVLESIGNQVHRGHWEFAELKESRFASGRVHIKKRITDNPKRIVEDPRGIPRLRMIKAVLLDKDLIKEKEKEGEEARKADARELEAEASRYGIKVGGDIYLRNLGLRGGPVKAIVVAVGIDHEREDFLGQEGRFVEARITDSKGYSKLYRLDSFEKAQKNSIEAKKIYDDIIKYKLQVGEDIYVDSKTHWYTVKDGETHLLALAKVERYKGTKVFARASPLAWCARRDQYFHSDKDIIVLAGDTVKEAHFNSEKWKKYYEFMEAEQKRREEEERAEQERKRQRQRQGQRQSAESAPAPKPPPKDLIPWRHYSEKMPQVKMKADAGKKDLFSKEEWEEKLLKIDKAARGEELCGITQRDWEKMNLMKQRRIAWLMVEGLRQAQEKDPLLTLDAWCAMVLGGEGEAALELLDLGEEKEEDYAPPSTFIEATGVPELYKSPALYKILGVDKSATPVNIKKAHIRGSRANHPDKGGDAEVFKNIQKAWEVLGDSEKKEQYDAGKWGKYW